MKHLTSILLALTLSANAWALPPQIEADRLLLNAKATLDAGDYEGAIQNLEKAEALNVKMPDTFYFHVGKAYSGAKKWAKARASYGKYLEKSGNSGKFYREALEGYNQADTELVKAEKATSEALNRYSEALERHKKNMISCAAEFNQKIESAERDMARAKRECEQYSRKTGNSCQGVAPERAYYAAEKQYDKYASMGEAEWCKQRYAAPTPPAVQ